MSHVINELGLGSPWILLALFLAGSFLMIWRLEVMTGRGMEGTVLGTLVMPYCSGMGNLIFVFVLGTTGGPGREVMVNCLVNNVTNLTLLIGLPALFWGMSFQPGKKRVAKREAKQQNINRLFFQWCSLGTRPRRGPRLRGRIGSDRDFYFLAVFSHF